MFLRKGHAYYFKSESTEEKYELYTDNKSKLIHLKRMRNDMIIMIFF